MATDEEVNDKRNAVVELRARVEQARSGGGDTQKELDNEVRLAQLEAEEERLNLEFLQLEVANDPQVLRRSADNTLSSSKDAMLLALDQQKATRDLANADAGVSVPPPATPAEAAPPVDPPTPVSSPPAEPAPAAKPANGTKNKES